MWKPKGGNLGCVLLMHKHQHSCTHKHSGGMEGCNSLMNSSLIKMNMINLQRAEFEENQSENWCTKLLHQLTMISSLYDPGFPDNISAKWDNKCCSGGISSQIWAPSSCTIWVASDESKHNFPDVFFFGQCHQLLQTPGNASYSHHMRLCVADDKQDPMTRCTSVGSDKNLEMIDVIWHYIVNKAELNSIDSGSKDLALTPNGSQVAIAESVEVLVSIHQYASFSVASPDPFTYVTCA